MCVAAFPRAKILRLAIHGTAELTGSTFPPLCSHRMFGQRIVEQPSGYKNTKNTVWIGCAYFEHVQSKVNMMELPMCTTASVYRDYYLDKYPKKWRAVTGEPTLSLEVGEF